MIIQSEVLKKLEEKDDLMICGACKKRVWVNWMDEEIKKDVGKRCAPCFFGKAKKI